MKKLAGFLTLLVFLTFQPTAWAQQISTPAAIPAGTATVAPPLPIPNAAAAKLAPIATQLGQTLQTLVGATSSQPGANATTDNEDTIGTVSDTFATGMLNTLLQMVETLKKNSVAFETNLAALPDLNDWLQHQSSDPRRVALWQAIGNDLLIIVGVPMLASLALILLLLPLRTHLRDRRPDSTVASIALLLGLSALRIAPVILFLGASLVLLDQNETHNLPRFVILNVIYAIAAAYGLRQILRSLFAPNAAHLRLLAFSTPQAIYACRWFSAFGIVIVYGYFLMDVATALRVPASAITLCQNLLALILTGMAIAVITQTRNSVAAILRGKIGDAYPNLAHALRTWLARHWHQLAIAYLVIGFAITALGIENGLAVMLRGTCLSLGILVLLRLCFTMIERWVAPTATSPSLVHRQILSFLLRPLIWIMAGAGIAATWGLHVGEVIATPFGQKMTGAFISILLTLLVLTALYEMLNAAIERHLERRDKDTKQPVASARARTLLPMVRNSAFILFSAITVITLLSAVGVNIGPLLAGAGVLGVAIGFGSQTLVKDFLTGLFIVVENTVAVGDVVTIGAFSGVVEALSIRTIRLRDIDGSLHILPFSEVSKITNMSKGFGYALVDVSVAYDSKIERVMQVLRDVGATLQEDPVFKRVILEPIEVMGVETMADSAIIIRARIRTRPGKQWDVRRLLLQRIKERFDIEKIVIPFPTVTHIMRTYENG